MHEHLQKAVTHLLGPLVRLLLRHGVSHAAFADWARQVFVREAAAHFGLDGKPPSVSRIAIVTGINRKEVKRLRELPADVDTGIAKHNRAIRVVSGWLRDREFLTSRGKPRVLTYGDADDSFNRLVKRHGGDVPARALLDELVRVGTVTNEQGRVTLARQGYLPQRSEEAMLDLLSSSAADLLSTLEHNLAGGTPRRLQVSVAYDNVSSEGLEAFRQLSAERAMVLVRELDDALAPYDRDVGDGKDAGQADGKTEPGPVPVDRHRTGLGLYFFED